MKKGEADLKAEAAEDDFHREEAREGREKKISAALRHIESHINEAETSLSQAIEAARELEAWAKEDMS